MIDFSSLQAMMAGVTGDQQLLAGAIEVRDFNASAATLAQANQQLLNVQQQMFSHMAAAMQMQQELFDANKEVRRLKEFQDERELYVLSPIFPGVLAYRYQPPEGDANARQQPPHFLCQPCFDKGTKSVLQQNNSICWYCSVCKYSYVRQTDDRGPRFADGHDDDPFSGRGY